MSAFEIDVPPFPKAAVPTLSSAIVSLRLVQWVQETEDTVSFFFDVLSQPIRHYPGQALALNLPMASGVATRTFTICSNGLDGRQVVFTVKAGPTAYATRWMHDHLNVGDELDARGPFGQFSLVTHPGTPLLLIGGGSGFTPMMSMLRWLYERRETSDVVVVQSARRVCDLLFRSELATISAEMPSLQLYEVVSDPQAGEAWAGYRGFVDRAMIRAMVPDVRHRSVFCCGPGGFMEHVSRVLRAEGMDLARFYTESFGTAPVVTEAEGESVKAEGDRIAVSFRGRTVDVDPNQRLNVSLAAQGLRVPTGCGAGQCGTCRLKLTAGRVEMAHNGGLSAFEEAQGYILACCSTPKGAIALEDPA
ncbi:flavin reductase family protein [Epibacterium ulvae]|uniref:flavin reductase family protein n=1 Tax=Epibacterium ulvae TaxID=1156985 RepID=UPI0024901C5B|nr:iron-sulfur cluster-binding domain-containing protein [Epibacterium ulvae]